MSRLSLASFILGSLVLLSSGLVPVARASGQLDVSFGVGGYTLLAPGSGDSPSDQAYDLIVDSAGRIVVVGFETHGSGNDVDADMLVMRLLPDGSPDPGFGIGGKRSIAFDAGGSSDYALSVSETASGGYVVCGLAEDDEAQGGAGRIAVARLLSSGAFDTSFDFDGRRVFDVLYPGDFGTNFATRCDVMPDGRIVYASGLANINTGQLLGVLGRLLADGSDDASFSSDGSLTFAIGDEPPHISVVSRLRVLADGRILVTGRTWYETPMASNSDIYVARFSASGTFDASFGDAGVRAIPFDQGGSNNDIASRIAVDAAGRIVVAGWAATAASADDFAVARLLPDGQFDAGFGTGGRAIIGFDGGGGLSDQAQGLAVDGAGRIYLAGDVEVAAGNRDGVVLRLSESGAPDASFGVGGWHVFSIDTAPDRDIEELRALALDASGRVLAAGLAHIGPALGNFDVLALRLTSDTVFADGFE